MLNRILQILGVGILLLILIEVARIRSRVTAGPSQVVWEYQTMIFDSKDKFAETTAKFAYYGDQGYEPVGVLRTTPNYTEVLLKKRLIAPSDLAYSKKKSAEYEAIMEAHRQEDFPSKKSQ